MIRILWVCMFGFALSAQPCLGVDGVCGYEPVPGLSSGQDASGWYLRCDARGLTHYQEGVDRLARSGANVVFYFSEITPRSIPVREWRGENREDVVARFAADTGLAFKIAPDGTWIVGAPEMVERWAVTMFVQNLGMIGEFPGRFDEVSVGRAIFSALPVRDGGGPGKVRLSGIGYLWLKDEPSFTFLVQTGERSPGTQSSAPIFDTYKVMVKQDGGRTVVKCIWHAETAGEVLPSVGEDFNKDGYRDFVFDASVVEYGESSLVSGKDGSRLLSFSGGEFAVRRGLADSPVISVEVSSASPTGWQRTFQAHRWDAEEARLVPVALSAVAIGSAKGHASAAGPFPTPQDADSVTTYLLRSGPRPGSKVAGVVVKAGGSALWTGGGDPPVGEPGFSIVGRFEPEGFKEERAKRRAAVPAQ